MMKEIFEKLDAEILKVNKDLREEGGMQIPRFYIKVLGQTALVEARLDLDLIETLDLDAYASFNAYAKSIFTQILSKYNLHYDELSSEIWMPEETEYKKIFSGDSFDGFIAKPEYILISKLLKAPKKNKFLILEYLAKGASPLFFKLCKKYQVNLEDFEKYV